MGLETSEKHGIAGMTMPHGPASGRARSGTNIRCATPADLERVVAIETASYAVPWSQETFRSLFDRGGVRFLIAEDGAELLGYAVSWEVTDDAELGNLAVSPHARRRGVGAALLDRMIEDLARGGVRSLFLEVRWSNDAALHLYQGRGFQQIAVRKRYYERPSEHARVLRLGLSQVEGKGGVTQLPIGRG